MIRSHSVAEFYQHQHVVILMGITLMVIHHNDDSDRLVDDFDIFFFDVAIYDSGNFHGL